MKSRTSISRRGFLSGLNAIGLGSLIPTTSLKAQGEAPILTFGAITDCHYADIPTANGRYYRDSTAKLAECVRQVNAAAADFLIELGDFKDKGANESATLDYLTEIETVFTGFNGPRYHVLGNHDMDNISKEQFLSKITNSGISPTLTHYSFDCKGWHFVVLDANFLADGTHYHKGNFDWRVAYVPQSQIEWLQQNLAATNLPTLIFIHQLLDKDEGDVYVNNAAAVRQVLESSGKVRAVFQGHHHPGSYTLLNNIHYVTLQGAIVGSIEQHNAFALIKIFTDRIVIEGFGDMQSRTLNLTRKVWEGAPITTRSPKTKLDTRTQETAIAENRSTLDTRTFSLDWSLPVSLTTKRLFNTILLLR